jgi:hypothetical protein
MSDLSNDTKKHTTKSRETIPLNMRIFSRQKNVQSRGKKARGERCIGGEVGENMFSTKTSDCCITEGHLFTFLHFYHMEMFNNFNPNITN